MAATKVWGFNEEGFNRVVEATRIVLRTPTTGTKRRRQSPVLGGGPQTQFAVFTIDSYDYEAGLALCTVEYRPYGVNALTNEIAGYEQIEVQDPAGCFFNEAEADLIGRWGTAVYMTPSLSADPFRLPIWVVIGLCCPAA